MLERTYSGEHIISSELKRRLLRREGNFNFVPLSRYLFNMLGHLNFRLHNFQASLSKPSKQTKKKVYSIEIKTFLCNPAVEHYHVSQFSILLFSSPRIKS